MNCHEAQTWILKSEVPALVPLPLADHLRDCGRCRKVHEQLLFVERQLQAAPLPGIPVHVKGTLMQALAETPVATRSVVKGKRRRRLRTEHVVGYAMATAASITIGLVMGYGLAGRGDVPVVEGPIASKTGEQRVVESRPTKTLHQKPVAPAPQKTELPAPENVSPAVPLIATSPAAPSIMSANSAMSANADSADVTSPEAPPRTVVQDSSPLAKAKFLTDDELLAQFIANHTEVSAAIETPDRLSRLALLSDIIWAQAIKEAQSGGASNGDWLKESYAAIVEIDLPAIARELPGESHEAAAALAVALDERAAEVERLLPDAAPESVALLKQLQSVSSSGAQKVLKKTRDPLTVRPRFTGGASTLLPMVIEQTIAVAREDNPLERANHSTELAEGLAKDIVLTALRGDGNRAGALGGHYGQVLEQSIALNLQRIDPMKATYQQTRRYQQVVARTQQSIIFLQQSLEAAPPQARAGLQLAMEQGGLAQLVPPPGPSRRVWTLDIRILRELQRRLK